MSDVELDDLDGGDAPEAGSPSKKKGGGGLGNLLPTILKFAAIGLGATVFIVTVSMITVNVVNSRGASKTIINDPTSPYVGTRPVYAYYDGIGSMSVRTSDFPVSASVTVDMIIGFDPDDTVTSQELISRRFELRDFVRQYFSSKTAAELAPERENTLKAEIREMLNNSRLESRGVRVILFNRLDVMENY